MTEMYPSDAALNALSGTSDPLQGVPYIAAGESPYYTSFYKMQSRLLEVARRAGDLRVFKDGDLTFGVRAGSFRDSAAARQFAGADNQPLADDAINSIYLTPAGVLAVSTDGFPASGRHLPLATIATGTASVAGVSGRFDFADITDCRAAAMFGVLDVSAREQIISVAAAIDLSAEHVKITGPAAGTYAVTLAAPTRAGVVKIIEMTATTGTNAVTMALANVAGGSAPSQASFDAVGETLVLLSAANKWIVLKELGVTIS